MAATASPTFGSLFSGDGGLDLGFESIGWECLWQAEIDKDCSSVLAERWPDVLNLGDITKVDWSSVPPVVGLAGGFPCQDLSYAGRGAGLDGERSGLWFDMFDVVQAVRPQFVAIENVPGLLGRGLHVVTHNLASAGYEGVWRTLAASDVGAPHRRDRVFVLARLAGEPGEDPADGIRLADFAEDGWESPQASLFDRDFVTKCPKAGAWTAGRLFAFTLDEWAEDEGDDESLLPTPSAYESTPTPEFVEEVRENLADPHKRLYLPGRKWHAQRTLSRIVPALLPTPRTNEHAHSRPECMDNLATRVDRLLPTPNAWLGRRPENATADPERAKSREQGGIKGKRSIELPDALAEGVTLLPTPTGQDCGGDSQHERNTPPLNAEVTKLLPTPVVTDSFGSRRSTARTEEWTSNPGTTLTDALWEAEGRTEDTRGKLLPTPTVASADGGQVTRGGDRDDELLLGGIAQAAGEGKLLPTPQAADGSGGRLDRDPETLETGKRPSGTKASVPLASAVDRLLPTPTSETNRKSTRAMTSSGSGDGNGKRSGGGMSSPPALEQVAELASGIEPHDLPPRDELPPETKAILDGFKSPLLPTPTATYPGGTEEDFLERKGREPGGSVHLNHAVEGVSWGDYEPAIRRWEAVVGRPAPRPTDEKGRLAPAFVEWMLGFPEGWVEYPGAKRTAQLRMLGNSVQVQCAQVVALWLAELGGLA